MPASSCGAFNLGSITPHDGKIFPTPVEEPLQNCLEFENRGQFAPGWNLARHSPNAALKQLEENLACEDHIANSGPESGDEASAGGGEEEVIEVAGAGVTQIGARSPIE